LNAHWDETLTALQAALTAQPAAPKVEPDGYTSYGEFRWACDCDERMKREWTPLYTRPPAEVDAELIERLKLAGRTLIRERKVYGEDVETLADVVRLLESLAAPQSATADELTLGRAYSAYVNAKVKDPTDTRERLRFALADVLSQQRDAWFAWTQVLAAAQEVAPEEFSPKVRGTNVDRIVRVIRRQPEAR
jgi:hypothetical protein